MSFQTQQTDVIREGFLCPECQAQFPTHMQLESHYQVAHAQSVENVAQNSAQINSSSTAQGRVLGSQLKEILGKAKKILKNDERGELSDNIGTNENETNDDNSGAIQANKLPESFYYLRLREGQTIGHSKDLFEGQFKQVRDSRIERQVLETNKLLITLDQLLRGMPMDQERRKIHEMNIVTWANDADVALCPSCAKSFNIGRRRHHCRLCGAIMCHDCSEFLEMNYAKKLINPVNLENPDEPVVGRGVVSGPLPSDSNNNAGSKKLIAKLSGASSLLNLTIGNLKESNNNSQEIQIRVCGDCKRLLDKRNRQVEDRHAKPLIKTYYEHLKEFQREADKLIPTYIKMCDSLRSGETTYRLDDGKAVRLKLMKLTDAINVVSRKIQELDVIEDQPPPTSLPLQNKLRLFASQYIRDVMCGLPNLPREEELEKLQEERHRQLQIEIELEKRNRLLNFSATNTTGNSSANHSPSRSFQRMSSESKSETNQQKNDEIVSHDQGWGIHNVTLDDDMKEMDPIIVQINILRDYIRQAREDHRYEEVNMLESNLKQLEIEYYLQD